jgi:hypothetical protein
MLRILLNATVVCIALLVLSSCGGRSQDSVLIDRADAFTGDENALPEIPVGDEFHPGKIVASASVVKNGDLAVQHSANVTIVPPKAELNPGPDTLAWAIYAFPGSPLDVIESVGYNASNRPAGHTVWVAIADYASGNWHIFDELDSDTASLPLSEAGGTFSSTMGRTYVAIMAWDGLGFDVDDVTVTYANRQSVSGQVTDFTGFGIQNVLVTTSLGGPGVMTDIVGNYTLEFIPEGTWHIMATKAGWVFYDYPTEFTVSGGPATGVNMLGELDRSHYKPIDSNEPNDAMFQAPSCDPLQTLTAYISAIDDPADYYRFSLATPGTYRIELIGSPTLLFPSVTVYDGSGVWMAGSTWTGAGLTTVGIITAAPQDIIVYVHYSGGGGEYVLDIVSDNWHVLEGEVTAGILDLGYHKVKADDGSPGGITYFYTSSFDGGYSSDYMRPLSTTITPDPDNLSPYGPWTPATITAALDIGDVTGANFNANALVIDHYEPNDTKATAHHFALPLTTHDAVTIRNTDPEDWYSVSPAAGSYLIVRVDVQYYSASGVPFSASLYDSGSGPVMYSYNTNTGCEIRSMDPCDGNSYYLKIQTWQDGMFHYKMTIEEVPGYHINIGNRWDGGGIEHAQINIYNYASGWTWTDWTDEYGKADFYFALADGETVFAELFRYGLNCNRFTKELTVSGGDIDYWFEADDSSADSLEPNNNNATSTVVSMPANIDATISSSNDSIENYTVYLTDAAPLHIVFTTAGSWMTFNAELYERPGGTLTDNHSWQGNADFTLVTDGAVDHRLKIYTSYGDTQYNIKLD